MRRTKRKSNRDALPEEFASLEEAGEFWDTHDSTDYEEYMEEIRAEADQERVTRETSDAP